MNEIVIGIKKKTSQSCSKKSSRNFRTNQSGYEPLNLENGLFVNSDNFDATDLRF